MPAKKKTTRASPKKKAKPAARKGAPTAASAPVAATASVAASNVVRPETLPPPPSVPTYEPSVRRELRVTNLRKPRTPDELTPREREQLELVLGDDLGAHLAREENLTEVAEIIDHDGKLAYHLYVWKPGVGYLFGDGGLEDLVAMGTQHHIEVWHRGQRDVFWAVDRAIARAHPRLGHSLSFGWRKDEPWARVPDGANERREAALRALRGGEAPGV